MRRGLITASRAADMMAKGTKGEPFGKTALGYARELAMQRVGIEIQDKFQSYEMERGIELEPDARAMFAERFGFDVSLPGFIIHPEFDFLGCTPDGVTEQGHLIEIKCPLPRNHMAHIMGEMENQYFYQVLFQMMVTGADGCWFVSYHPAFPERSRVFAKFIEPDYKLQDAMIERAKLLNDIVNEYVIMLINFNTVNKC